MELTIDQALQKGIEAHKAGQIQEADRLYTAIIEVQPKHPNANHNLGILAVSVGKVQDALPFLKVALDANPNTAQFWLSYIDALIKLERLTDAKVLLDQARSNGAKGERFDELKQRLGEPNEVPIEPVAHGQEKEQVKPNTLDTLKLDQAIKLAGKKSKEGSPEEANHIYQDILKKFPKNKRAVDGVKALGNGPVGRASKAQEPPHDQQQLLINLYSQGKLKQALEQANILLEQFSSSIFLHNICGGVYKGLGQLDDSVAAYNKTLTIKPNHADAHFNKGNALKEQGKLEEAIKAYKKVLAIKPDHNAYLNMGVALKEQGKLEEAIKAYKKVLAIKPDHYDAHFNIGNALKKQGMLEEAIEAYNKALTIKPDYADVHCNIGNALKKQGMLEEAIDAYNKALTIKPDYVEAFNNMGNALKEQGKMEEALEAYQKALAIKPDYAGPLHTVSALTGITTNTAPRDYVEKLFDEYAEKFDDSLLNKLEYRTPKIISDLARNLHGTGSMGSILDLGCGTGLLGVELKKYCSSLEGVDLSQKMLKQAKNIDVYNKLNHMDIVEYLSKSNLDFDYFMSTDVFVYVGELSDVFRLIKSRNKRRGKLIFSTEHTELNGFHLEQSGRYSHSRSYIEALCLEFDYYMSHFSIGKLRKEKGQFLSGGLYVLDF